MPPEYVATRRDPGTIRSGVLVWVATLVGGMLIRGIGDGRVPHWSFMVVAAIGDWWWWVALVLLPPLAAVAPASEGPAARL